MPLGSSSAAPVMTPGPRRLERSFRDMGKATENAGLAPRLPSHLAEGLRTVEFAYVADVGDHPGVRPPLVQGDRRRLHHHAERRADMEIKRRLMRGAGCDRSHGAGPAHLDRAMDMAADGALDIAVPAHQLGQPVVALLQAGMVEGVDAAFERRVV